MFNRLKNFFASPQITRTPRDSSFSDQETAASHSSDADAHFYSGIALQQLNRHEEALLSFNQALQHNPDHIDTLNKRAVTLRMLQKYEESIACVERALQLKPDHIVTLNNHGNALQDLKRFEAALISYDRALQMQPDYADAWYNRGIALLELEAFEEALASFDHALTHKPGNVDAANNRGLALRGLNRLDEAIASFELALQIKPDHPNSHFNEGSCRLLLGDFTRGWEKYEWRWESEQFRKRKPVINRPLWLGAEPLQGKTLLVHAEQGLGDTIQFCRYAKLLSDRGVTVLLAVQPSLTSLLADLNGVHMIYAIGEPVPGFDFHCPLLSLPLALNTQLDTIPADIPYLRSEPDRVTFWQTRLGAARQPRIGLAWAGSHTHENDRARSIPLEKFIKIVSSRAQFVSLHKEIRPEDQALIDQLDNVRFFGNELEDFADTAALVELVDLVITVDTSVAHLAGAMGKPVWLLLPFIPDWRWLLNRADSPWYPTARLFRQQHIHDWDNVITTVADELNHFVQHTLQAK